MNKNENQLRSKRRLYSKPQLEQIQLVLEEAVLETCKTNEAGPLEKCRVATCARTPKAS